MLCPTHLCAFVLYVNSQWLQEYVLVFGTRRPSEFDNVVKNAETPLVVCPNPIGCQKVDEVGTNLVEKRQESLPIGGEQ